VWENGCIALLLPLAEANGDTNTVLYDGRERRTQPSADDSTTEQQATFANVDADSDSDYEGDDDDDDGDGDDDDDESNAEEEPEQRVDLLEAFRCNMYFWKKLGG